MTTFTKNQTQKGVTKQYLELHNSKAKSAGFVTKMAAFVTQSVIMVVSVLQGLCPLSSVAAQ